MHKVKLVCLVKCCSEGQAADPAAAVDGNLDGCHCGLCCRCGGGGGGGAAAGTAAAAAAAPAAAAATASVAVVSVLQPRSYLRLGLFAMKRSAPARG